MSLVGQSGGGEGGSKGGRGGRGDPIVKVARVPGKRRRPKGRSNLQAHNQAKVANAKRKEEQIVDLRGKGLPFSQIAERVGLTAGACREGFDRAIARAVEGAREALAAMISSLDQRQRTLWAPWEALAARLLRTIDDPKSSDTSIAALAGALATLDRQLTQVAERRARLLGLDAPVKSQLSGSVDVVHVDATRASLLAALDAVATNARRTIDVAPALPVAPACLASSEAGQGPTEHAQTTVCDDELGDIPPTGGSKPGVTP
jgi:hypothetical protein